MTIATNPNMSTDDTTIATNPNMSTDDTTIFPLAKREMSLEELARRINLNVASGWGLHEGTPSQLNGVALYCQKHDLLPGDDVTLYDGKTWITVDGRVKLMRRQPTYRGYSQRPLSATEKEEWGWNPKDIVIETTVRTTTYGEMKAFGRVSAEEAAGEYVKGVRHNAVARVHPVEMAQKRSLARAERLTFGTDSFVDDEELDDTARVVIEERTDPARVALQAATYERIQGSNDDAFGFAGNPEAAYKASRESAAPPPEDSPQRAKLVETYAQLVKQAIEMNVIVGSVQDWIAAAGGTDDQIIEKGRELRARVNQATIDRAKQPSQSAPEEQLEPPTEAEIAAPRDLETGEVLDAPVEAADKPRIAGWAQHRQLLAEAHKRSITVPTLNARTALDLVEEANVQLEQRIRDYDLDAQLLKQQAAHL